MIPDTPTQPLSFGILTGIILSAILFCPRAGALYGGRYFCNSINSILALVGQIDCRSQARSPSQSNLGRGARAGNGCSGVHDRIDTAQGSQVPSRARSTDCCDSRHWEAECDRHARVPACLQAAAITPNPRARGRAALRVPYLKENRSGCRSFARLWAQRPTQTKGSRSRAPFCRACRSRSQKASLSPVRSAARTVLAALPAKGET
jgi:hypothetical protein